MSIVVNTIFERINSIINKEGQCEFISVMLKGIHNKEELTSKDSEGEPNDHFQLQKSFLLEIFTEIDNLATEIKSDNTILISVKNQKLLRTCFQLVTTLGISSCLLPGLGLSLTKRCSSAAILPPILLTDEQKYEILTKCTDFFTRSYEVPVLKNIILTLHLSDYLAALIQLSFAPLKKPGIYNNFTMTQEMFNQFSKDRQKYVQVYEHLVANCFQPILMKELLVLQSVTEPSPPAFVRRTVAKEMSRRLLVSGGLLSLIRCFIESYDIDTGFEWKKIDMICKIVAAKHGNESEEKYLRNICSQLMQILSWNNMHYLATAVLCVLCLNENYPQSEPVKVLVKEIFQTFDYDTLISKSNMPGTVILSPQEIESKINVLHACVCTSKLDWPVAFLSPNLYVLYLLGVRCTNNEEMKVKLKDTILKCLEQVNKEEVTSIIKSFLFGREKSKSLGIAIDEFEAGLAVKCVASHIEHPKSEAIIYFLKLIKTSTVNEFVQNIFESSLQILIEIHTRRQTKVNQEVLLDEDDDILLDDFDEQYATILQLLTEICTLPKVVTTLKTNPSVVLNFVEYFILKSHTNLDDECVTISLVLLNTILSNSNNTKELDSRFSNLKPVLKKMAENEANFNSVLCKETLSLISSEDPQEETAFGKAISEVFDNLLPIRAHGIIELTKLIDTKNPEAISKKHYVFCLFQEQLKDPDSYIYLSAINGITSLGTYCPEDVLQVLCAEFLQVCTERNFVQRGNKENNIAELRMKIGDTIVKVIKRLGEMAVVHKTLLLNTMLSGCRDNDPLIRTSAMSNLAEIALVLHYKVGTIIYEILLCIWSTLETDLAVECRRAAVMAISSLLKGLGKETLVQLKENLLPIYRTLKKLYNNPNEDSIVRLHAQIGLEELNDTINQFLFPELKMERKIFVLDKPEEIFK